MTAQRQTLSVVLMTKHEEPRLAACLDRVAGWADEIVIIDDCSQDRTVEVARRYTDRIFSYASEDDHYRQWNRGIDHASGDWILHIDADELVTPELKAAIDGVLRDAQGRSAFDVMRRNYFLGHPMRYGGWYHRHRILFRRDRARCVGKGIHVQLQVDGSIGFLNADIEHHPFASLSQFLDRQNHYTTVEARVMAERQGSVPRKTLIYQAVIRPPKLFWKYYVKKQGYRDGWHGLAFSVLYAFVHFMFWAKYWELTVNHTMPPRLRGAVHAAPRGHHGRGGSPTGGGASEGETSVSPPRVDSGCREPRRTHTIPGEDAGDRMRFKNRL